MRHHPREPVMLFDMDQLDLARSYKLLSSVIVPRPIAWVVSQDARGQTNAAPYSLFNFFGGHPPVVCIGMGHYQGRIKDSLANICATQEFVINLVTLALAEAMNTTAVPFPAGINELDKAGLQTLPCTKITGRRIAQSPVALECRLQQMIDVRPSSTIVVANVVAMHIDDACVTNADRCYIDSGSLEAVGRMESPGWYTKTAERFAMQTPMALQCVPDGCSTNLPKA
ncbi:flavin reductase family protein [Lampropedia aestuarii]|uniref:flavin reductase family protein n=1 Tax=Lampropedia aestuarii TaxID=2562762 RepID=UPI0024684668|nr:flavin reductase family protein [Lampropedia aestuarii]MDH5855929.1 flavin reductase family protein [Lampropedia aestuarii]